jgi:hypothetical protein
VYAVKSRLTKLEMADLEVTKDRMKRAFDREVTHEIDIS